MRNRKWRIAADVPLCVKSALNKLHPPRFEQVHLSSVTWAHGVDSNYPFDGAHILAEIYGLYRGKHTEAFAVTLADLTHRPDGRLLSLSLSSERSVPSALRGLIDQEELEPIDPIGFTTRLIMHPMWNLTAAATRAVA